MPSRVELSPEHLKSSLPEFLAAKLKGSSLQVKSISENEVNIEAIDLLLISVAIDSKSKKIFYALHSPKWNRDIRVEELDGFEFLEAKASEELKKEDLETSAEDVLLSIDLMRAWAKANNYQISEHVHAATTDELKDPPRSRAKNAKR